MSTALGLDIGGTRIKAGIVNHAGRILKQEETGTPVSPDAFRRAVRQILDNLEIDLSLLAGVGIGCKGVIEYETTRVNFVPGHLRSLEGELLRDLVPVDLPVYADNDAKVAMAGEMVWGAARGRKDAIMLTLGTGVGGAVVANGQMLRGVGGVAGHLGHITVETDGPLCTCGNYGCLETLFSADAITVEAYRVIHSGCISSLTDKFRDCPESVTCKDVFEAAASGDSAATLIRDRAIHHLAAAISGLLHVFDPEIVILGGQIAEAGETLRRPLEEEVHWRSQRLVRRAVPVVIQEVQDRSGIVGGAALVFSAAEPA
jgi:glucokinase